VTAPIADHGDGGLERGLAAGANALTAQYRPIARYGGVAKVTTHVTHLMRVIGQTGARLTIERHSFDFWPGLMDAKEWRAPRQVSIFVDLCAGRNLADLDRAASTRFRKG
jgi:hypothetical protein